MWVLPKVFAWERSYRIGLPSRVDVQPMEPALAAPDGLCLKPILPYPGRPCQGTLPPIEVVPINVLL
jgi:hypothetical protein